MSDRYRLLAVTLYLGTMLTPTHSWFMARPPLAPFLNSAPLLRFMIFMLVTIVLLFLDLYIIHQYHLKLPKSSSRLHLIVRVALVVLAFVVASLEQVIFIHLLLMLYAYFTLGRNAELNVALINFVTLFLNLAFGPRNDFISALDFGKLLTYSLGTIFALLLGNIIAEEAESKEQARHLLDDLTKSHQQLNRINSLKSRWIESPI